MRRTIRPDVEALEGKALLSGTASSGLAVRLTEVAHATSTGPRVVFTLVETNISHHAIRLAVGPSTDGFMVSQGGKTVWVSNPGPLPQFLMLRTLKPNQSLTLRATWDDRSNQVDPTDPSKEGPLLSGTFTVENGLDRTGHGTTFSIPKTEAHVPPPKPTG